MVGNKAFAAGIGSTNIDLLYSGLGRLPKEGEELYSHGFSLQLGGGVPATMTHLGRLGVPTKLATALGDDIFSEFAKAEYKKNGVFPLNLCKTGGMPLNVSTAMITAHDRTFVSYGNGDLRAEDGAKEDAYALMHGAKVAEMQPDAFLEVYKQLKADGTVLVLDSGWNPEMSLKTYAPYLETADYYTPNQKEALQITGTQSVEDAARVLSDYFPRVVIKLDRDGCLGYENGAFFTVPPIEAFTCVDSTGAGDAFLAGFLYGLYHEYPLADCILFGNITGGKCVTQIGCLNGFVTETELLELHQKYKARGDKK